MSRLQQTDGLTEDQNEILKPVREFVDEQILPVATELEHADEYPTEIVEGLKELGIFGLMIPEEYGGLGESLLTYALVRRGDRPRLDERQRHHQHPLHRRLHAACSTAPRSRSRSTCRGWRPARCAARSRCPSPGCGSDVAAIKTKAVAGRRRRTSITGQKMWLTNGGSANLVAVLVKTDEGADSRLQEHDDLPGREGAGLRRDRPGRHHPRQDREDGLQGRRHHRAGLRGPPDLRRPDPRRRAGQGLLPDDGRRRGRPRQRRRPRLRRRQPGLRARHRLRPAARDLRQEDRRAPGGAVPARRDGDQGRGRPPDDGQGRPDEGPGERNDLEAGMAKYLAIGVLQRRSSRTPSASTAATATPRSTRSSGSTARRRCCSSARAPPTSRG